MQGIRGLAIILGFNCLGEGVVRLLGIPIPGSLIGMLAMATALNQGWIREAWVASTAQMIIGIMPLFFVPAVAAFVEHSELFRVDAWAVIVASALSTLVVFASVGWTAQFLEKRR